MFAAIRKFLCKNRNRPDLGSRGEFRREISNSYTSEHNGILIRIRCTWCGTELATLQRRAIRDSHDECNTGSFLIYHIAVIDNITSELVD